MKVVSSSLHISSMCAVIFIWLKTSYTFFPYSLPMIHICLLMERMKVARQQHMVTKGSTVCAINSSRTTVQHHCAINNKGWWKEEATTTCDIMPLYFVNNIINYYYQKKITIIIITTSYANDYWWTRLNQRGLLEHLPVSFQHNNYSRPRHRVNKYAATQDVYTKELFCLWRVFVRVWWHCCECRLVFEYTKRLEQQTKRGFWQCEKRQQIVRQSK